MPAGRCCLPSIVLARDDAWGHVARPFATLVTNLTRVEPVTLRSAGLVLRPPVAADVDDITLACQDQETATWVPVPVPYTREAAEGFLQHLVVPGWASGRELTWAIHAADAQPQEPLLGMVGLHGVADGSAEIGFWTSPWARQRGVMSASVQLVLDHAFAADGLDLERVTWVAQVGNWPSRRVAWRAGFRLEGTIRLHALHRGVRHDAWVGTLLRDDPRQPAEPWPDDARGWSA